MDSEAELVFNGESKEVATGETYYDVAIPEASEKDKWEAIIEALRLQYPGRDFLRTKRTDYGGKTLEYHYLPKGMSDYGTHWRKLSTLAEDHYYFMGYYYLKLNQIRKERVLFIEHEHTTDIVLSGEGSGSMIQIVDVVTPKNSQHVEAYVPELVVLSKRVY